MRTCIALAGLAACTRADDEGPPPAEEMSVVLGTGATAFAPVGDGDPVTLVHGLQGGWHVEVAGAVDDAGAEVGVAPAVFLPSRGLWIAGDQQVQYLALADYAETERSGVFFGVRAFVDDLAVPPDGMDWMTFVCSLAGEELEVSVAVTDLVTGDLASATVLATAALDPTDVAACD